MFILKPEHPSEKFPHSIKFTIINNLLFIFPSILQSLFLISPFLWCFVLFLLLQTRQPVFVQLLQGVFRVYHCNWLVPAQKASVESCIKVLSDVGKYLTMTIPNFHKLSEPHAALKDNIIPIYLYIHPLLCFK